MNYTSTRDKKVVVSASRAISRGISAEGGLFVPTSLPQLSPERLNRLAGLSYTGRAADILGDFLDGFSAKEIQNCVETAYTAKKFGEESITQLAKLGESTYMLELWHGPTCAFKDMALQLLPYLVTLSGRKNGEEREISILVATSGDTGKAALEGFKDVPGTSCTVFYPQDGVSDVQKRQMTTTGGDNTHVIAVDGNFDDAQTGVKALFASKEFAGEMDARGRVLSSANSINFGRLVPQIVYYFSAYADLVASGAIVEGDYVNFVVPTGNFGNILACYYARCMGLPVGKMICASNRNNVLTDFFRTGCYSTERPFFKTTSPSMDILVSSNLERLLYEMCDRDSEQIVRWMNELKYNGVYHIDERQREWLTSLFDCGYADDERTAAQIRHVFETTGYLMDTHTAVAGAVLDEYRERTGDPRPAVIVSTASPYKFAADVLSAVKGKAAAEGLDAFACSDELERVSGMPVPTQVRALRELPIRHKGTCGNTPEEMAQAVHAAFGD